MMMKRHQSGLTSEKYLVLFYLVAERRSLEPQETMNHRKLNIGCSFAFIASPSIPVITENLDVVFPRESTATSGTSRHSDY